MSTEATSHNTPKKVGGKADASPGKGKNKVEPDVDMEVEEDDDDDDEEEEEGEEEEEDEEIEEEPEVKPENILSRRTRGKKIDYTSPEALQKAGLQPEAPHDDEDEEGDFHGMAE